MALTFREADEVETIANGLIDKHHGHLVDAEIRYVFTSGRKSRSQVCTGLLRYFGSGSACDVDSGPDFVIEVATEDWSRFDKRGKKALVDHLLSECGQETNQSTGEDKWVKNAPDVREFRAVIARNGLFSTELRELGKTLADLPQQLRLVLDDEPGSDGQAAAEELDEDDEPAEVDPEAVSRIQRAVEVGARA